MARRTCLWLTLIVLVAAGLHAATSTKIATDPATDGYLYGTVTTRNGTVYTGIMRWGDEEAFWDDLFHSGKEELPYAKYADEAEERDSDERWWQALGRKIASQVGIDASTRIFVARFGDIQKIEVVGRSEAEVTVRSGTTYHVCGYANDAGATITVHDTTHGAIELPWKNIRTIDFAAVPAGTKPVGFRLYGTVTTDSGEFTGHVQWDEEESLSIDKLDGDSSDGRVSIPMGTIASIERRSRSSALVTLKDGRELTLDGTNDVNSSIRGIFVEDPSIGRVETSWSGFERVVFSDPPDSGRGYDEYRGQTRLRGTVTDTGGQRLTGTIVYDLDESESWEMLNGESFDLEYTIPFERISSIERQGSSATVTLRNGEELRLSEGQDVAERNDGVVVETDAGGERYISWRDVRRIDFSW